MKPITIYQTGVGHNTTGWSAMSLMHAFVYLAKKTNERVFITDIVFGFPVAFIPKQPGMGSLVRVKDGSLKIIVRPRKLRWAYREVLYNPGMESVKQVTIKGNLELWSEWCLQMGLEEPPGTFEQVLRRLDE